MAKRKTTKATADTGRWVLIGSADRGGPQVKFGIVTISGNQPPPSVVKGNVERSTQALERVSKRLIRPGVNLRVKRDVPQFSVDENESGVFIRRLNGRVEKGRLINGSFRVIDEPAVRGR